MKISHYIGFALFLVLFVLPLNAQFSPGELSFAHKSLEGLNNCTECHTIGSGISEKKCLDCHKPLKKRIDARKGYHSSKEVKGKECISCHSEHHGRKFDAINLNEKKFNHDLTGYSLIGGHAKVDCRDCHKPDYISDKKIAKNKKTFLGLKQECLSCHEDYHQGTLPVSCLDCHDMKTFEEAPKFNHDQSKFPLKGAHNDVECVSCHKMTTRKGKKFQVFTGLKFDKCIDCHKDPHENKFGQNCIECHNENSWHVINKGVEFDHNKTGYPLEGLHVEVDCKECHTNGFSENLNYAQCIDCHEDYHDGDFTDSLGNITDCNQCHEVDYPFTWSNYGIDQHQKSNYPLTGAHEAVSCLECHKPDQNEDWNFTISNTSCVSCHDNVHEGKISEKFLGDNDCEACHNTNTWSSIEFDHDQTQFKLEKAHTKVSCRECHSQTNNSESEEWLQEFMDISMECIHCHEDVHKGQFVDSKEENHCERCHSTDEDWQIPYFDHQKSEFPLEGKHEQVQCSACHKPSENHLPDQVIWYKIEKFECRDCHGT